MEPKIEEVKRITNCRLCGGGLLVEILNLGVLHISDFPRKAKARFPPVGLKLVRCAACELVQLEETCPRNWMYREYFYRSGLNESMINALGDVVASAMELVALPLGATVIDIGANDGTLLSFFVGRTLSRVAFEPALNLGRELSGNCEMMVPDFFPPVGGYKGPKAKIITSIAMFYDLEDPNAFVKEIARVLDKEGVWVCQFTDLRAMVEANAWDSVCHEHLCYYSFNVFAGLVGLHGLDILDVERNDVNGGSVRYYVVHRDSKIPQPEGATARLQEEMDKDVDISLTRLRKWAGEIEEIRSKVLSRINGIRGAGRIIDVLGASTKGNTLLQYFGLDGSVIRRAIDRNDAKDGRMTVGTWIGIVGEEEGHRNPADVLLVLPWGFKASLLEREKRYLATGGRLLFPMPRPVLVSKDGEEEL